MSKSEEPSVKKEVVVPATIGRTVHYVLPEDSRNAGEARPAVVVRVWPGEYQGRGGDEAGYNLQVFTDGSNDGDPYANGRVWKTNVRHDETKAPGTWHWPPRV